MKAKRVLKANVTEGNADRFTEICRTAAQFFYEKGFDATSVSDIADAMKLTKAALYYYIEGKQELLFEIMNRGMDALEREVIAPAEMAADANARLEAIIHNHARQIATGNHAVTIISDEVSALTAAQRKKITARRRAYFDFVRITLDELKTEGKLHDVDTTVAAFSVVGMILWVSRWYQPGGSLTPDDVSREISKIAFNALLSPTSINEKRNTKNERRTN